ncbi:MAG: hypothetical protein OEY69_03845, partial [Candidatus Krumholzibacteria bacterium]|nr:hypothetical protein [Candidatus Krumholzibacteria bacterium]
PRYPRLAGYLAVALQRSGRNEEARKLALEIVASGDAEDKATAYKILATAAFFDKDLDAATRWVRAGLEAAPDDPDLIEMMKVIESMPAPSE